MQELQMPPEFRLIARIDVQGPDDCWLWTGSLQSMGYGRLEVDGRDVLAHRYMYKLAGFDLPDGVILRHACDNPACCNPRHHIPGTQLNNMHDKYMRGRDRHSATALTSDLLHRVRDFACARTYAQTAAQFGITEHLVWKILARRTWLDRYLASQ